MSSLRACRDVVAHAIREADPSVAAGAEGSGNACRLRTAATPYGFYRSVTQCEVGC